MESWAVWSIVCVLFGMAGFWGGVLQHGHSGPADGGLLTNAARALFSSVTQAFINNSTVSTVIMSYNLPAGTVGVGQEITLEFVGNFTNNTGIAQNEPDFEMVWNNTVIASLAGNTTAFAASPGPRPVKCTFSVTNNQAGQARVRGETCIQEASVGGIAPAFLKQLGGGLIGMDFTIDQLIEIRARNRVANVNYESRHLSSYIFVR